MRLHARFGAVAAVVLGMAVAGSALAQDSETPAPDGPVAPAFPISFLPLDKEATLGTPADPTRILNGDVAAEGAWPWQVGLISVGAPSVFDGQFCGGSLIAGRWVLTAAHCVYDEAADGTLIPVGPGEFNVLVGTNYLEDGEGEVIAVEAVYAHPDYDPVAIDDDIALIRLAAAPTDPDTNTISLASLRAEERLAPGGVPAIVTGWGKLQDGRYPIDLRQVQIFLYDRAECVSMSAGPAKPGVVVQGDITENMICSGVTEGGKGSCNGDSGGPLMIAQENGTYVQVGVVSWGYTADNAAGCSLEAQFSAYTRVAVYEQWMRDTIAAAR